MCKQDVQIGRSAQYDVLHTTGVVGTATKTFSANPNRLRVSCVVRGNTFTAASECVMVGVQVQGVFVALVSLTQSEPSALLRVEDYGQLLLQDIFVFDSTFGGGDKYYTDIYLKEPLESI